MLNRNEMQRRSVGGAYERRRDIDPHEGAVLAHQPHLAFVGWHGSVEQTRPEFDAFLDVFRTRQVAEGHARAQSLLDQIGTTGQNLATASETLRLTRERKLFGVGAVLEDIQAQQELARARSDHLSAVADFNKAQYGLSKAVG